MMNTLGLIAGLSTFLGIWLGHVGVRKIEHAAPKLWLPVLLALLLGLICEYLSLQIETIWLSTVFGILGVTLLWDGLELMRQEMRVKKGHAPANPSNPRHINFILEIPAATVQDFLDRDPIGQPVSPDKALQLFPER
ncbi:MAG: hypothetical protein A2X25_07330 [Chloroflexi bacterium GWB2_49_20]|nr:MAG: hypothetical protein A2X25_07330 [Chloroflexi bacterium GWB2_49_20]OGN77969.1 MAG: hypothetical protein A2X26_15135 [Chloroflexi bacterium GWC2_49_37]OGN85007.1 MAG: hypothetical protein A2X27_09835 [Chloroflexi bacterium GWD2_49_16]